jgi:hypothetical protein
VVALGCFFFRNPKFHPEAKSYDMQEMGNDDMVMIDAEYGVNLEE